MAEARRIEENMEFITGMDPEVGGAIRKEYDRQCRNIELIASENVVSPAVMAAMGTVLTNKYAEGYPGKRGLRFPPAAPCRFFATGSAAKPKG